LRCVPTRASERAVIYEPHSTQGRHDDPHGLASAEVGPLKRPPSERVDVKSAGPGRPDAAAHDFVS
jgi:hypothetical protein